MDNNGYTPSPLDTSRVQIDGEVRSAIDELSRNVHDLWAQQRMAEGWVYGPLRDQLAKTHPGLVPYDELSDSERAYDQNIATQTVLALRALGYDVKRGAGAPPAEVDAAQFKRAAEDAAARVQRALGPADAEAVRLRNRYRGLAWWCSILGTLAVLLAIAQLFVSERHHGLLMTLFVLEGISALVVGVGVIYGIRSGAHHGWLLERHKSERLRALHALSLIALFEGKFDSPALDARIEEVSRAGKHNMEEWLRRDVAVEQSVSMPAPIAPLGPLDDFRAMYMAIRLAPQSEYLVQAEAQHERLDRKTRRIPPILFFASVACVLVHVALHPFHTETAGEIAHVMLLLAAMLPVIASGLRTYREAVQFSRNASRFAAKAVALRVVREQLVRATTHHEVADLARRGEDLLESEHREWLRLMMDAEWFA
jgi:hypothetical protein